MNNFDKVLNALAEGDVVAYPTEAVFGLGCDPDNPQAIKKLLALKQRPVEKGLILIAATYEQLRPYIDEQVLTEKELTQVKSTWPGPITWIMPASEKVSEWVSGSFDTIAVRVSDHPLVQQLCLAFGKPITSTSANLTTLPPCVTEQEVHHQFEAYSLPILSGETGGRVNPSEIRDARTLQVIRKG